MPTPEEIEAAERTDALAGLMSLPGLKRCARPLKSVGSQRSLCEDCGHPMGAHPAETHAAPHAACTHCTTDALWTALVPLLAALQDPEPQEQSEATLLVLDWRQGVLCTGSGQAVLCPLCDGAILMHNRMTVGADGNMRHAPCPK